jgi:predicted RNA-binding protein associated with RNAse of E/G family
MESFSSLVRQNTKIQIKGRGRSNFVPFQENTVLLLIKNYKMFNFLKEFSMYMQFSEKNLDILKKM